MQNAYCESFNGRMRDELLNESLFFGLDHARAKIAVWTDDYNRSRLPRLSDTRPRPSMRPTSPQWPIGCATPTNSADRPLLNLRQTAHNPPRL